MAGNAEMASMSQEVELVQCCVVTGGYTQQKAGSERRRQSHKSADCGIKQGVGMARGAYQG